MAATSNTSATWGCSRRTRRRVSRTRSTRRWCRGSWGTSCRIVWTCRWRGTWTTPAGLDMTKLLTAFGTFFGEHSEHWLGRFSEYPEAGPPAHLAGVPAPGGERGRSHRAGVRVGAAGQDGPAGAVAARGGSALGAVGAFVVECKVLRDSDRKSLAWTVERGVEQTLATWRSAGGGRASGGDRPPGGAEDVGPARAGRMEAVAGRTGRGVVVWTL